MGDTLKIRVARRVMDLVRQRLNDPSLDRAKCETELRRRGMKAGNAQRLLDDTSDVQLTRLADAADLLGVTPADLLSTGLCPAQSPHPPIDEALHVVLDAIAQAPDRHRLRTVLQALLDDDAPAYRLRLAELLAPSPIVERTKRTGTDGM